MERNCKKRNLDTEATYSYDCPDEINETPGLKNKEGISWSVSYQNRECKSENPYYGESTSSSYVENDNSHNYGSLDRNNESDKTYAEIDDTLTDSTNYKRGFSPARSNSSIGNPSFRREFSFAENESSTCDLESDNHYYGGIVPTETNQADSRHLAGSNQKVKTEDAYAEIQTAPSNAGSHKRNVSTAEYSSISADFAFDNQAYGVSLPLDHQMNVYGSSVPHPVCDEEYSSVATSAACGNASHYEKVRNHLTMLFESQKIVIHRPKLGYL